MRRDKETLSAMIIGSFFTLKKEHLLRTELLPKDASVFFLISFYLYCMSETGFYKNSIKLLLYLALNFSRSAFSVFSDD